MSERETRRQVLEGILMGLMVVFAALGLVRFVIVVWGLA